MENKIDNPSDIQKFTVEFFTNLKCQLSWQDKVLVIRNIPGDFESFAGKKGPYNLVFSASGLGPNCEFMTKGSFLLKTMASYLDRAGQTALIKITGPNEITTAIKQAMGLQSGELYNFTKRAQFVLLTRFTFLTTLQYVNEKEQMMNEIYVKDGQVIDFDLSKHQTQNGSKNEIAFDDLKPAYAIAKSHLRTLLEPQIKEVSDVLSVKVDKEVQRVKDHYDKQIQEYNDEVQKQNQVIEEVKTNLFSGKDVPNSKARLDRAKEILAKLEAEKSMEKLLKEKEFFINDEIHRHSLAIDNKLINTTLIYYPIYSCSFSLRANDVIGKPVELAFNTLDGKITPILCEACSSPLTETMLCSSGHMVCPKCTTPCRSCGRPKCKACSVRLCGICGQDSCRKCLERCSECGQHVCKNHLAAGTHNTCTNCLKTCSFCSQKISVKQLRQCPSCHRYACAKCASKALISKGATSACTACSKQCSACGEFLPESLFKPVACQCRGCKDLRRCSKCRVSLCPLKKTGKLIFR